MRRTRTMRATTVSDSWRFLSREGRRCAPDYPTGRRNSRGRVGRAREGFGVGFDVAVERFGFGRDGLVLHRRVADPEPVEQLAAEGPGHFLPPAHRHVVHYDPATERAQPRPQRPDVEVVDVP